MQAQYARILLAGGTLVATPGTPDADLVPGSPAASDVLGTGWFGAVAAEDYRAMDERRSIKTLPRP